jgi:hypothetical protein
LVVEIPNQLLDAILINQSLYTRTRKV